MMRALGLHHRRGRGEVERIVVAGVRAGMHPSRPPAARESGSSPARGERGLGSEGVALHQSCNACRMIKKVSYAIAYSKRDYPGVRCGSKERRNKSHGLSEILKLEDSDSSLRRRYKAR